MNIEKADYSTIVKIGGLEDLELKLKLDNKSIEQICDWKNDENVSILESCLVARKFNIAKILLEAGANVNVITKDGYNELHCIAPNIGEEGAIDMAYLLLNKGVDLNQKDNVYGNTAFLSICIEILKHRPKGYNDLIKHCMNCGANIMDTNKRGVTAKLVFEKLEDDFLKEWI